MLFGLSNVLQAYRGFTDIVSSVLYFEFACLYNILMISSVENSI